MKFLNIFEKRNNEEENKTKVKYVNDLLDFFKNEFSYLNLRGKNGKNALKEATVYTCVKIRAESIAKLPLKIYKDREEHKNHYLYYLLKNRPNPFMSSVNFWKAIESQRALKGNAYAYIERDKNGNVIGLYPIDSEYVTMVVDDRKYDDEILNRNSNIWYIVNHNGEKYKLFSDEVLHFVGDITLNGIVGIPPLDYIKCIIENGKNSSDFINKFFKNGLSIKGIIQYVGDLSPQAKKTFIKEFEEMSNGLKNAHSVSMLPIGYQFQPISLNMADAQFLQNCKLNKSEIATIFGIKSYQLNDLERATFSNIAEQQKDFYISTLQSMLEIYEQEIEYKLLSKTEIQNDVSIVFNADSILRSNIKERYEAYRTGINGGFLTPNEARQKENLPPLEGGDNLVVNGSVIPLNLAGIQYKKENQNEE